MLIWIRTDDRRLGPLARDAVNVAVEAHQALICPISFWEVGLAISRRRFVLDLTLLEWRADLLRQGYIEHSVTGVEAIEVVNLPDFHGDPGDRLMVSVARIGRHRLLTSDRKILRWPGDLDRIDSRI